MKKSFVLFLFIFIFLNPSVYALDLSAESAYIMCVDSNDVIFSKNSDIKRGMASTTKIMTAIVAIENANINEYVTVSANAASQEGSSIYLRCGNIIKLEDLLYGMMLNSGNDAACAVAEYVGGSIDNFSQMMTKKAQEIGAINTQFKNPSGLDEDGHFSTAEDMAKITAYAMKNETFKKIVSTKNLQINVANSITYLKNHNKLLWNYDGCIGVKTGFTKKDGRCLVSYAERDGISVVAVTLNASNDWNDHKKMLDYGFMHCEEKTLIKKGDVLKNFSNYGFNAVSCKDIKVCGLKNKKTELDVVLHTIKAPRMEIKKGEKIGYGECFVKNNKICEFDLLSDGDYIKEKKTFIKKIAESIKNLLRKK